MDECLGWMHEQMFQQYDQLEAICFHSHERNVRIFDGNELDKRQEGMCVCVRVFVCVSCGMLLSLPAMLPCSVPVDGRIGEASS